MSDQPINDSTFSPRNLRISRKIISGEVILRMISDDGSQVDNLTDDEVARVADLVVIEHLDTLEPNERVEKIDDLIHRLNFERRLTLLTPNQRAHMDSDGLSEAARAKLDELKGTPAFDRKINEYARSLHFRRCAWVDYLNNGGTPPVPPNS